MNPSKQSIPKDPEVYHIFSRNLQKDDVEIKRSKYEHLHTNRNG